MFQLSKPILRQMNIISKTANYTKCNDQSHVEIVKSDDDHDKLNKTNVMRKKFSMLFNALIALILLTLLKQTIYSM